MYYVIVHGKQAKILDRTAIHEFLCNHPDCVDTVAGHFYYEVTAHQWALLHGYAICHIFRKMHYKIKKMRKKSMPPNYVVKRLLEQCDVHALGGRTA